MFRKPEDTADAQSCTTRAKVMDGAAHVLTMRAKFDYATAVRSSTDLPSTLDRGYVDLRRHNVLTQNMILPIQSAHSKNVHMCLQHL